MFGMEMEVSIFDNINLEKSPSKSVCEEHYAGKSHKKKMQKLIWARSSQVGISNVIDNLSHLNLHLHHSRLQPSYLPFLPCNLYSLPCTLYPVFFTLYYLPCTLYPVLSCTLHSVRLTMYSAFSTLHSPQCRSQGVKSVESRGPWSLLPPKGT